MSRPSPTEIAIRAYTERPGATPVGSKPFARSKEQPSPHALIFDCETTTDAAQRLRVGFYQVRKFSGLEREGIFYDPEAITVADLETISRFAATHGLELLTVAEFRTEIFLKVGYDLRANIVGFNLPFDLSRIAIDQGPARGAMRGGFTFNLTADNSDPNVRVKHLSARAALIDFAVPGKQETPRGMRKQGRRIKPHRGQFTDVKTLAAALTSQPFSLARLASFLGTNAQKLDTEEHGGPITDAYLEYARTDVQATWECYETLTLRFSEHGLDTEAHRILSEASLGKGYLKQMGVKPLLLYQPDIPRTIFGTIMASYFGGRAEVHIRRVITQVQYCDFKSMYPTVNSLMGLWRFVIGSKLTWHDTVVATQEFLNGIALDDLQKPGTWQCLSTLCRIKPNGDILPVRAPYDGKTNTIGLNYLTSDISLWYTLADCIASKLLTGKAPIIEEAITFDPGPVQDGLKPFDLFGRAEFRIDPNLDDLFTRLVDLRDQAKAGGDPIEKALKTVANSTVYGIFIEVNRDDAPKPEPLDVFGPDGECTRIESTAIEEPGRFYHPLLGTLITGAARLMLAITEALIAREGLEHVFCDTDSMAIAKPEGMDDAEFGTKCQRIIDWFKPLNPYRKPGSILKIEDINFGIETGKPEPLFCFAISSKRYVLVNIDRQGAPIIRKASAHGLGHLIAPYGDDDAPTDIPAPSVPLSEIGVKRWQYDLWFKIIHAALAGHPNRVPLVHHPALQQPAVSRYGATSPKLLAWVARWNEGKPYADQIKPFGFMLSFMPKTGPFADFIEGEAVDPTQRGRPSSARNIKPVAPFDRDHASAISKAFDRETGEPIYSAALKTYAEALAQFHLSTEDKFENGDFYDVGPTIRRPVFAANIRLIGKEANNVGPNGEVDPSDKRQFVLESNPFSTRHGTKDLHYLK